MCRTDHSRISRHIFPSLGLGQLQSSLHEGSKQAVRSSMLGLLSPIKHHSGSHEPKKHQNVFKKKRSSNYPYLSANPWYSKRNSSFLCLLDCSKGRSQKWLPYSQWITTAKKKKHPLPRSMYLGDCSKLFPNQLLIYCRMVDQLGNLVQNSPRFAPCRSAFLLQPEVTQRSILSHERSLHPNVCCKGSNSYAMSTSQNLDSRHHKWWIKSLKVIFYPFLLMGKPPKKVPKGKDSNSNQAFTLKWDEIRKAAPQNQNKLRFILNFASKNNRLRLLEDSWKKQLRH